MTLPDRSQPTGLLDRLSAQDRDRLCAAGARVKLEPQVELFRQGDQGDAMYVVMAGQVVLRAEGPDGELEIRRIDAGHAFGEMAVVADEPRSTGAVTGPDGAELVRITTDDLFTQMREHPAVLRAVLAHLSTTVRLATEDRLESERRRVETQALMEIDRHRAIAQMVAGVAHEVNTPLGLAHHAASLIEETVSGLGEEAALSPAAAEALDTVAGAAQLLRGNIARAADLVKSFKHLSVAHAEGTVETVGLSTFVDEVVRIFEPQARAAKLAVTVVSELPPEREQWTGRAGHLSQVLLNLLSNVQRYAYDVDVGGPVEVRLTYDAESHEYALAVVDHGRGVDPAVRDTLFDAFVTTGRGSGGSGLGLAIVHNLCVTSLGGGVRLTDTVGGGTTMTVTLPSQTSGRPASP